MQENDQIREELLQSVSGFSDQQLNEGFDNDSWSIMQNLEHLYLMECLVTTSIYNELNNENSQSTDAKPIHYAVNHSRKVKAPSILAPSNNFIKLKDIKKKLQESREALTNVVNTISIDSLDQKSFEHPIFGLLSLTQWITFIGFHEKRHLDQIEEIKQNLNTIS
jgi:hypothetical protein